LADIYLIVTIISIMASSSTPSPNSPPATLTSKKDKKDDTGLFERIGTFGRKKKAINKDG